jgi:hypothetical protein
MKMSSKNTVSKISHKLAKVSESYTVNMYDNGFMFEISGRDTENEYRSAKILCSTIEHLVALVKEADDMERDD